MRYLATLLFLLAMSPLVQAQTSWDALRPWTIVYANAAFIQQGKDLPNVLSNDFGSTVTVRAIACFAQGGTVTINPTLTGRSATSILQRPLVCPNNAWASGAVNGAPSVRPFATNGATCPTPPCTIDANIESVTGAPTYLLYKVIVRRLS